MLKSWPPFAAFKGAVLERLDQAVDLAFPDQQGLIQCALSTTVLLSEPAESRLLKGWGPVALTVAEIPT